LVEKAGKASIASQTSGVGFLGVGWLRGNKNGRPVRQEAVHQRPPYPLYLDGGASWKAYTGPDDAHQLGRLPVGSEIVVEAAPEPSNRNDPTAVALLYQGSRVAYLYQSLSRSLFGAIRAANAAGYHVLLHAKRISSSSNSLLEVRRSPEVRIALEVRVAPPGSSSHLEVRAALAADLYYWLNLPPQERGTEYFELAWVKTDYQDFYQDCRKALLGNNDSLILPCTFSSGSRSTNPYGHRPPPDTTPKHPDIGTFADVHAAGQHIGELRKTMRRPSDEGVLQILSGCHRGMARLEQWPDNIELRVCIADSDGHLPKSSEPFLWQAERREAEHARLEANLAAMDAEKVDGQPLGHCKAKVADLKRAGDLDGALALAMKMVDAAEQAAAIANRAPHAWVTLDAAIILRKLNDVHGEIALLERYLQHCPPGQAHAKITERLDKLR
jgi:hypothetical protein